MSKKEKLLVIWLLVLAVFVLVFRHFWAITVYALGKAVALNLVCLPGLTFFGAGFFGLHFLP